MLRIGGALLCTALLAGCSGGMGTMDGIMDSWAGAPLDAVIAQWGYPDQEQTIAGRKLYRWFYTKGVAVPATSRSTITRSGNTATVNTTSYDGGVVVGDCTRTLEVDARNIVIRSQWQGNNCPFAEGFEYSNWRRKVN
jgi:hypothetical protein